MRWLVCDARGEHPTTATVFIERRYGARSAKATGIGQKDGAGEGETAGPRRAPNAHPTSSVPDFSNPTRIADAPAPSADALLPGDRDVEAGLSPVHRRRRQRRIGQIARWADAVTRPIGRLAVLSAVAAVALWAAWLGPYLLPLSGVPLWVWGALALLLVPSGATWLLYGLLRDLVVLPQRLAGAVRAVASDAQGIAELPSRNKLQGIVRVLWAARALAFEIKGAPLRYAALLRLARLPVMIPLLFALAADAALVAAAVAAVVIRLMM